MQEQGGDHGHLMERLHRFPLSEQLSNGVEGVVPEFPQIVLQCFPCPPLKLCQPQVGGTRLQAADTFQQALLQVVADTHHFAGGFHLRA